MSPVESGVNSIVSLVFVTLFVLLMVIWRVIKQPRPGYELRPMPALNRLRQAIDLMVESGRRLHVSLGHGEMMHPHAAVAFVGLRAMQKMVEDTAVSDRPTVVTAGTGLLGILARSSLQSAHASALQASRYRGTYGRVTGLTPFSYAVGALLVVYDEAVSANFLIGSFGPEVALIADRSIDHEILTVGGTDNIVAQAVLYASADEPLIGEEVFASGAYINAGVLHATSLLTQDIFRWILIVAMLAGALIKMLGVW